MIPANQRICQFALHRNGAMHAWFSIELASGLVPNGLRLMIGDKGPWIAMPAVRQLDRNGQPRLDANGSERWNQVVEFRDRAASEKFRNMAVALLRRQHPEAFE